MSIVQLEIQLVAIVVAVACALPGVFLVLRRMAMMSDAISHAILPGIVLAFFVTHDVGSPFLIAAAGLAGLFTVVLVEVVNGTGLVREDAAIGLVFPVLFSAGVILIARFAGDVHLDTDAVLLGELAFAPFDRFGAFGYDLGPRAVWVMGGVLALNIIFLTLFYKELKIATIDAGLATALGFAPTMLHYALMGLVSITAVSAFDAVGSILVVALMVGPPAAAYLLTDRLSVMMIWSATLGAAAAVAGYWGAHVLDASIAGGMATAVGLLFAGVVLLAPDRGLVAGILRRRRQKWVFAEKMLVIHLLHHEDTPEALRESRTEHLQEHLRWDPAFARQVVAYAADNRSVERRNGYLALTDHGRRLAREALAET